jgi:hypothetical protein
VTQSAAAKEKKSAFPSFLSLARTFFNVETGGAICEEYDKLLCMLWLLSVIYHTGDASAAVKSDSYEHVQWLIKGDQNLFCGSFLLAMTEQTK